MSEEKRILIIDDEPGICQTMADILESHGYQAISTGLGRQAIDLAAKQDFMAALIDINLPDISGTDLLRTLKEQSPEMACIIMTGCGTMEHAIDAIKAEAYDFFVKPIDIDQILHRLKGIEEKQSLKHELADKTAEIEEHRNLLSKALKELSGIISNVSESKDFGIRFQNPDLQPCFEIKGCARKECPCYGGEPRRCWQIAGTYCGGVVQGEFASKYHDCSLCEVYKHATSDPVFMIGEEFNNMMHILESKNNELLDAYDSLKNAQSQMVQQEKLATIGQLAAGVAHEVNNPVGFITSNLGSLGKYTGRLTDFIKELSAMVESMGSDEEVARLKSLKKKIKLDFIVEDITDLIKESLDGADRVKKIVQNLKSFSRSDEKEHKYVDIHECIESAVSIAWNELKYKCTVEKDYSELPHVPCYPHQLNQVIMNLLVNGAQAIEDQGKITIKTWQEDDSACISIADTGCGIAEENLEKIFEPFFTTKESGKGTGLGMSIASDIMKKHNGGIRVESEVGRGTTFTLRLPLGQEA